MELRQELGAEAALKRYAATQAATGKSSGSFKNTTATTTPTTASGSGNVLELLGVKGISNGTNTASTSGSSTPIVDASNNLLSNLNTTKEEPVAKNQNSGLGIALRTTAMAVPSIVKGVTSAIDNVADSLPALRPV